MTPRLITTWARAVLEGFAAAGVRRVVVCPGSRSTPFTAAALERDDMNVTWTIDERGAAFFALGHARATGEPALVIATSGSAGAHFAPAVAEAALSYTPLILLTADRPPEAHDAGANQTMAQHALFGAHARACFELGAPAACGVLAARRKASQAVLRARYPEPGPVHVNAPARKPLEPGLGDTPADRDAFAEWQTRPPITRAHPPRTTPSASGLDAMADALRAAERPLLLCGTLSCRDVPEPELVAEFARRAGALVCTEPTSGLRFCAPTLREGQHVDVAEWLLATGRSNDLAPDYLLRVGGAPIASEWEALLDGGCTLGVIAPHGWPDPSSRARDLVLGDPSAALRGLIERLPSDGPLGRRSDDFLARCQALAVTRRRVWEILLGADDTKAGRRAETLTETGCVHTVVNALPAGSQLVIGNSLPVRELSQYCPARSDGPDVLSQRGVSGIDGLVAGAAGAAAARGCPTTLLLGDVSLVHDLSSLALTRDVGTSLAIVVINNGGGRIFEQLPVARSMKSEQEFSAWTTPHGLDLAHAAALYGVAFQRPPDLAALSSALTVAHAHAGVTLIEVRVAPQDAAEARLRHLRRIAEAGAPP